MKYIIQFKNSSLTENQKIKMLLTRAGLSVVPDSICLYYTLEPGGELVAPQKCWWCVVARDTVHK